MSTNKLDADSMSIKYDVQLENGKIESERGEETMYNELQAKYGNINELEAKVKMQAEAISIMEASLRDNENEGELNDDTMDPDPLNTSNGSNAYEDDFEASKSPMKLNKHEYGEDDNLLMQKYEASKIEPYGETQESAEERKSTAAPARGIKVIGALRKSLSKESATSDILSIADKLLDGEHDDVLG